MPPVEIAVLASLAACTGKPIPAADGTARTMRVSFDDGMWEPTEDRLFDQAFIKRYGVDIGDAGISF